MISPYSSNAVDSHYYSQINVVKTIEQILGVPAMNQQDLAAEPMYNAFTDKPNFAPCTTRQPFNGPGARVDAEKPALLNRLDWYSAHNWTVAYPGDPKIYTPEQVPGRTLAAAFLGQS